MWLGCLELEISLFCHNVHTSKYARYIFCGQTIGRQGQKEVAKTKQNRNKPPKSQCYSLQKIVLHLLSFKRHLMIFYMQILYKTVHVSGMLLCSGLVDVIIFMVFSDQKYYRGHYRLFICLIKDIGLPGRQTSAYSKQTLNPRYVTPSE